MKVSVIIPVYNAAALIGETLDSVLGQTLGDLEVICVDDGSKDNSAEVISEYAKKDARVVLIRQENAGAGAARNAALDAARGDFVAFMDPDDWYPTSETLEHLYEAAIRENVAICGGGWQTHDENGKSVDTFSGDTSALNRFSPSRHVKFEKYQCYLGYTRFIYSRALLNSNEIRFPTYARFQDPPFFVRAMIAAKTFYGLDEITYCYRIGHKTINWTADGCAKAIACLKGMCDVAQLAKANKLAEMSRVMYRRCNTRFFNGIVRKGLYLNLEVLKQTCRLDTLLRTAIKKDAPKPIYPLRMFMRDLKAFRHLARIVNLCRGAQAKVMALFGKPV